MVESVVSEGLAAGPRIAGHAGQAPGLGGDVAVAVVGLVEPEVALVDPDRALDPVVAEDRRGPGPPSPRADETVGPPGERRHRGAEGVGQVDRGEAVGPVPGEGARADR